MKNRVLRALLLGAALGGLVLSAMPAQAASISWDDPGDDAKDQGGLQNAAFDITTVKFSNDGGVVKAEMIVPGMVAGAPTGSAGYTFRFEFSFGGGKYRLQVNEHTLGGAAGNNVGKYGEVAGTTVLACAKCEGKIDRKTKTVTFTAPLADLDKALQSGGAPPLAGKEWTALNGAALRQYATVPALGPIAPSDGLRYTADSAPAPEGSTLAF